MNKKFNISIELAQEYGFAGALIIQLIYRNSDIEVDNKSGSRKGVWVRIPPSVPTLPSNITKKVAFSTTLTFKCFKVIYISFIGYF